MVGAFEARQQPGRGDRYVVEYHGEPVAAVVPIELYEGWKRRREALSSRARRRL